MCSLEEAEEGEVAEEDSFNEVEDLVEEEAAVVDLEIEVALVVIEEEGMFPSRTTLPLREVANNTFPLSDKDVDSETEEEEGVLTLLLLYRLITADIQLFTVEAGLVETEADSKTEEDSVADSMVEIEGEEGVEDLEAIE